VAVPDFLSGQKIRAQNRLRKSQMDSTKMSQTNPTCISPEKMMTLVSYVPLFQAMAKTVIFYKLPFLHRFGCF